MRQEKARLRPRGTRLVNAEVIDPSSGSRDRPGEHRREAHGAPLLGGDLQRAHDQIGEAAYEMELQQLFANQEGDSERAQRIRGLVINLRDVQDELLALLAEEQRARQSAHEASS